jgi:hypothetical protein
LTGRPSDGGHAAQRKGGGHAAFGAPESGPALAAVAVGIILIHAAAIAGRADRHGASQSYFYYLEHFALYFCRTKLYNIINNISSALTYEHMLIIIEPVSFFVN